MCWWGVGRRVLVGGRCGNWRIVKHIKGWPGRTIHGSAVISWKIPSLKWVSSTVFQDYRGRCLNYFAISEISDTVALLNQKVYPSRASFSPGSSASFHRSPHPQATGKHTSPDGGIGRRAGLKHQWSNPCRFDPGSGYTQMAYRYL